MTSLLTEVSVAWAEPLLLAHVSSPPTEDLGLGQQGETALKLCESLLLLTVIGTVRCQKIQDLFLSNSQAAM